MDQDKEKSRLLPNALLGTLQALVTGAVMFFLYRFLLRSLGVEAVGLWSLILATTSVAKISELGLSSSAIRYVSKHLALGDESRAADALQTATLSIAILLSGVALLILPLASWLLAYVLEGPTLLEGRALLPFALVSLWLTGVGAAVQAGLRGCHRADLSAIATIIVSLAFFALAYLLVPHYGIFGLAYAQLAQGVLVLLLSWAMLRRCLPNLPLLPLHWSKPAFLEMWRYGVTYQLTALLALLGDAFVKGLLSYFGSLSAVGYYEIAYRMVTKVQQLYMSAGVVMVPYFSKLTELDAKSIPALLGRSTDVFLLLSLTLMGGVAALLPLISIVWIGHYEPQFVQMSLLLIIGTFIMTLTYPVYLANMGTDKMNWNLLAYVATFFVTIVFGVFCGLFWDGIGVVGARAIALIGSSVVLAIAAGKAHATPLGRIVFTVRSLSLTLATAAVVVVSFLLFFMTRGDLTISTQFLMIMAMYASLLVSVFLWHPEAKNISASLTLLIRRLGKAT